MNKHMHENITWIHGYSLQPAPTLMGNYALTECGCRFGPIYCWFDLAVVSIESWWIFTFSQKLAFITPGFPSPTCLGM